MAAAEQVLLLRTHLLGHLLAALLTLRQLLPKPLAHPASRQLLHLPGCHLLVLQRPPEPSVLVAARLLLLAGSPHLPAQLPLQLLLPAAARHLALLQLRLPAARRQSLQSHPPIRRRLLLLPHLVHLLLLAAAVALLPPRLCSAELPPPLQLPLAPPVLPKLAGVLAAAQAQRHLPPHPQQARIQTGRAAVVHRAAHPGAWLHLAAAAAPAAAAAAAAAPAAALP